MLKLSEKYKAINLISSTTIVGDFNSTAIDLEGYEDDALVIVGTGAITSTGCTYAINIQGSTASAGTYTTLASFNTFSGTAFSNKIGAIPVRIGNSANKFIKVNVDTTVTGGTISAVLDAKILVRPTLAEATINSATLA